MELFTDCAPEQRQLFRALVRHQSSDDLAISRRRALLAFRIAARINGSAVGREHQEQRRSLHVKAVTKLRRGRPDDLEPASSNAAQRRFDCVELADEKQLFS